MIYYLFTLNPQNIFQTSSNTNHINDLSKVCFHQFWWTIL